MTTRFFRRSAALLALLGAAAAPSVALAKDWVTLPLHPGIVGSNPETAARQMLVDDEIALGTTGLDLQPRLTVGKGSTLTVLLEQRWGGLRVIDRGGAVRFIAGDPRYAALDVARGLKVSVVPALDDAAATLKLSAKLGRPIAPHRTELAVLGRGDGLLVWVLDVREDGTKYVVDANTGKLVLRIPVMLDGVGRVYPVNSVQTPMTADLPLTSLTMASPLKLDGWNGLLRVTNYVSGSAQSGYVLEQSLVPTTGTDFLYDPPANPFDPKDGFAQVNLYYHLTDIRDYFTALGLDLTTSKWKLTAVANAMDDGSPLDNAFYSPYGQDDGPFAAPNLIGIGQGGQVDFSYDSDVFKHEFGHYVAGNTTKFNMGPFFSNEYGLQPLSSAIDEGLADYFACSDNQSAVLGEAALAPFGSARDLSDVSKRCPDNVGIEAHADGELIGSASWSIRELIGQARADKLVWGAETMLPPGATFGDFYQGMITTMNGMVSAGELTAAEADGVQQVLASRGMHECGPVIPLHGAEPRSTVMQGLELLSYYIGEDCFTLADSGVQFQAPFQFSRTTDASDQALRFHVEMEPDFNDFISYTVYIRRGSHVTYTSDQFGLPQIADYDWAFSSRDYEMDAVIDANSSPPFVPGEEYFVSVSGASCPNVRETITASNTPSTTTVSTSATSVAASSGSGSSMGGEGGGGDVVYIDRGCGCVVASDATRLGGALAMLGLGAAMLVRRRRRA